MVVSREYRSASLTDAPGDEYVPEIGFFACTFEFAVNECRLARTGGCERKPVGPVQLFDEVRDARRPAKPCATPENLEVGDCRDTVLAVGMGFEERLCVGTR